MSIIQIRNLSFTYPTGNHPVFDHVSFTLDSDWKLGLIGRNGRGKTTLLHLLENRYEYSGNIVSSVPFTYFPYTISDPSGLTLYLMEEKAPQAEYWQIARELSLLDMDEDILYRPYDSLSGGEQTKVMLAALFLNEHTFLLIDEPTNHLDAQSRDTVCSYLKKKKGFILVSHDRHLLDTCVDHILSINRTDITVHAGNFSTWYREYTDTVSSETEKNRQLKKDIGRLEKSAAQAADWSDAVEATKNGTRVAGLKPDKGRIGHKAAKMMKRSLQVQKHAEQAIEEKSRLLRNVETSEALQLHPLSWHSQTLAVLDHFTVAYDGTPLFEPVSFTVKQGERIAVTGSNGCGKSSLLRCLLQEDVPYEGTLQVGKDLVISYVPQDTSGLSGTLYRYAQDHDIDTSLFLAILRKMGFERNMFEIDISEFSMGQKKLTALAGSLASSAHLYIWDEPLNYIDVFVRMQIEELLSQSDVTILFVEHDDTFTEKTATDFIRLSQ